MTTIPLTLRYANRPVRRPAAWFVGGATAGDWLGEVGAWGVPAGRLTFYAVPASLGDGSPRGALVTVERDAAPTVSPRAVPYGCVAGKLYLPVDAELWPPVGDDELKQLFGLDTEAYVWHPVCGLTAFDAGEGISAGRLLAFPPALETDWSAARSGTAVNGRLWSVEPEEIPVFAQIIEQGRSDIGSRAEDLTDLPPSADESPVSALLGIVGLTIVGAATAAAWLAGMVPHIGLPMNWFGGLERRLQSMMQQAAAWANVNSSRVRELNRLLNLLKSDPDEGLKFALPFGGESHRGQAPPSGRLARREVNFDLSRLRGGGPADFWNVPYQIQQQLREEYRRLANRELNLGRHRRAAYIFAELLGELPAAAGALVAGRHFREAAVLYQERLQQPLEAAKCLEQGGLWAEALQLYEKLGEFEKAGDLARRLEQFDDATRLYREAERAARSRHDYLAAARILEQKLDVADEALDCLTAGCRSAHEGRPCLAALFELLGRLGRHDIAREHVVLFRNAPEMRIPDEQFAGELAKIAQTYPDEPVRAVAADSVRIVVGARLTQATPDERYQLLLAVKTLAPEDRLLDRDCRRYIETHTRAISRNVAAANANKRIPEVTLVREYRLPEHVHWVTATSTDSWYYAAGYRDRELIAVRGTWSILHELSVIHWDCQPADASRPILLVPDPQENSPATFLHCPGRPTPVIWKAFYGVGQHDSNPRAGTPPWASSFTLAVARDAASNSWALNWTGGNASLNTYDANNAPLASRDLSILEAQSSTVADLLRQQLTLPIEVGESATYIGLGTCLAIVRKQANVEYVEMPHPIQGLSCSVPHTRNRVAVTFETGGQVFWDEPGHRKFEWFGTSLSNPQALFTNRGWLVAASSEECQVYSTNEGRMRLAAECRWTDRTLLALLKTGAADEFAVCCADGRILTYRVPENA